MVSVSLPVRLPSYHPPCRSRRFLGRAILTALGRQAERVGSPTVRELDTSPPDRSPPICEPSTQPAIVSPVVAMPGPRFHAALLA